MAYRHRLRRIHVPLLRLGVFEEIPLPLEEQAHKFRNLHLNIKCTSILTTQAYPPLLPFPVPLHHCTHLVTFNYQSPSYQPPSYQSPSYQPPSYQPPSYQLPSYQPPSYQPPSYQSPSYQSPSYQPPSYQSPSYQSPSYSSAAPTPAVCYVCTCLFPRVLFFYLEVVGRIPLLHYFLPIKLHGTTFQKTVIFSKINDSLWGTDQRGSVSAMTVRSLC